MIDAFYRLLNNLALIHVPGYVMRRCANQFNSVFMRLVVRLGAFEAGKK